MDAGAAEPYGTRPQRRHAMSLAVRIFLLMFGASVVAFLQFIYFHQTMLSPNNQKSSEWQLHHHESIERELALLKQKYASAKQELNKTMAVTNEMQDLKNRYGIVMEKLRTLEDNKREEKPATEEVKNGNERREKEDAETHAAPDEAKKKPNILLLYADDWRYDSFSAAGNKVIQTPVLDKLAKEGVMFTHNCVTTSICGISRATLQTGQYFSRHKVNPHKRDDESLPGFLDYWNETLNGLLRNVGYYIGFVGKWQIRGFPSDKFDVSKLYYGFHIHKPTGEHVTEMNERDSLKFLKERPKDKPFFLTVSFFATHALDGDPKQYIPQNRSLSLYTNATVPVAPSATEESWNRMPDFFEYKNEGRSRWRKRFQTPEMFQHNMKNLYRMVTEVDSTSGRILKELEQQGVLNDTLVIFTTDNGNFHAEHGLADKWYPHQESIRVPLVIKDPRMPKEKVGTVNDEFTLNVDLAPTIVSAAGITPPARMQGRDISDLYLERETPSSKVPWRKHFFYEHPVIDCETCIPSSEALVVKDSSKYLKLFFWPGHSREQLFDIRSDPYEENDLIQDEKWAVELQALRHLFNRSKEAAL